MESIRRLIRFRAKPYQLEEFCKNGSYTNGCFWRETAGQGISASGDRTDMRQRPAEVAF
jgi:hypothetical protein